MFRRKPNLKPLAPLRSSDRRKLVDVIIRQYGISTPTDDPQAMAAEGAAGLNALRNEILPEGTLSASFVVVSGIDEKIARGTIYTGAYPGEVSRVLWVKMDDGLVIPSVYTLWRRPGLTPLLHTPSAVIQKMREGADLNTPGLAGPPFPEAAKKGAIVAVASVENPSVPMAVGICEIDISRLTEVRGQKGHAVRPLHCEGDEIWKWSQYGQSGDSSPKSIEGWLYTSGQTDFNFGERDDSAPETHAIKKFHVPSDTHTQTQHESLQSISAEQSDSKEWNTQEVDTAFRNAFLYGVHQALQKKPEPTHGIHFPISQSQLISMLITPYLPIFSPDDATALQMKKTSWKTVKKFIKSLDKAQLLKSRDRNGGETVILDIDFADQAVATFQPYSLPQKDLSKTHSAGTAASKTDNQADPALGQRLQRLILLRPKDVLLPLFPKQSSSALYLRSELRSIVTKYIEDEALVDSANKRLVNMNSLLAGAVFNSNNSFDSEVLAKGSVPRDVLLDRIIDICAPFFLILKNEEPRDNAQAKPGKPPMIKMSLETRSGNKTITRLSGLETFGVYPQMLAEELQKACASSTTVTPLIGNSHKAPQLEVMVQGPQKDVTLRLLERRGVRKEWVEVADKTKGKKK